MKVNAKSDHKLLPKTIKVVAKGDAKGKKVTYKLGMEAPEYFLAVAHLVRLLNKYYQEDLGNNEVRNSYTIISRVEVP